MDKQKLRLFYKKKREKISEEEMENLSLSIANQALTLPIWDKTYYHVFLPIRSKKEVNTEYLLHILHGRDKSIVIPKADFTNPSLKHFLLQENTVIKNSSFGIPEPDTGIEIPANLLDVVFVPLLAYDSQGNRLGYGKGFYDQFLKTCKPTCIFVGLSFFEPENALEHDTFDVPLHYCVTPNTGYTF